YQRGSLSPWSPQDRKSNSCPIAPRPARLDNRHHPNNRTANPRNLAMKRYALLLLPALLAGLHAAVTIGADERAPAGKNFKGTWKKITVDKAFRSEGVGVVDVNKDGKKDIVDGDVWYEAPDWKMHVLSDERKFPAKGWDPRNYSESFAVFADDFN